MLVLSTERRLCSLNLSLRHRLVSPMYCKWPFMYVTIEDCDASYCRSSRALVLSCFSSFQITKLNKYGPIKVRFLFIQLIPISSLYNVLSDWCSEPDTFTCYIESACLSEGTDITRLPTRPRLDEEKQNVIVFL